MNLGTILVAAAIAVLFILAVRYLVKNKSCSACGNCRESFDGCGGNCGGCSHSGACRPK
jgi:hypothetical protein